MMYGVFTIDQVDRIRIAQKTRKYGHLATWQELFFYQRTSASPDQVQAIAVYAKRKNDGEKIKLPLMYSQAEQKKIT